MKTAIFVDLAFVLRRLNFSYDTDSAELIGQKLYSLWISHLFKDDKDHDREELYRIFIYDCEPLSKKVHYPISKKALDYSKSNLYKFRTDLQTYLIHQRKVALRLGRLSDNCEWVLKTKKIAEIINNPMQNIQLTDEDFKFDIHQKGVDMRMGIDITSVALKHLADKIILITGDADFVPAAKLARREGVDVILDPMWSNIHEDLYEHIDGLRSTIKKAEVKKIG